MKNNTSQKKAFNGIGAFTILYFVGVVLVVEQLIEHSQWTIKLIKKWKLPEEAFFSKVNLTSYEVSLSIEQHLSFAIAYIIFYSFILVGLIQLNSVIKLLSEKKLFLPEISSNFKKAGKSFLIFVMGTFFVDLLILLFTSTSRKILELFSTETVVFIILSFLLFFLSDILKEGVLLKEENDLTI